MLYQSSGTHGSARLVSERESFLAVDSSTVDPSDLSGVAFDSRMVLNARTAAAPQTSESVSSSRTASFGSKSSGESKSWGDVFAAWPLQMGSEASLAPCSGVFLGGHSKGGF